MVIDLMKVSVVKGISFRPLRYPISAVLSGATLHCQTSRLVSNAFHLRSFHVWKKAYATSKMKVVAVYTKASQYLSCLLWKGGHQQFHYSEIFNYVLEQWTCRWIWCTVHPERYKICLLKMVITNAICDGIPSSTLSDIAKEVAP